MPIRPTPLAPAAFLLFLMACAPAGAGRGPVTAGTPPAEPRSAPHADGDGIAGPTDRSSPLPREANADDPLCAPLLLDQDYGFGTHVVMRRLPTAADLEDLHFVTGLRQVLLALPEWPASYAALRPLQQALLPEGTQIVVLLPGWPPTREALGAWNLVGGNLRLIIVVEGPPADRALIAEINHMRALERIIAQMDHPSRAGFERLQRPLSFRVLKN